MKPIVLPQSVNYIAAFLTLRCNMACPYCINKQGGFVVPSEMSPEDWLVGLRRLRTRSDLPITLQGGEPTIYQGFYGIAQELHHSYRYVDLLTNGTFNSEEFLRKINPYIFKRDAPYASIRFSYHGQKGPKLMALMGTLIKLRIAGYSVGLWGLSNQENTHAIQRLCDYWDIDFRVKEYLDSKTGTYKYPEAIDRPVRTVLCKPSEFLIAPDGKLYRCHADLYASRNSYGHLLDEEVAFPKWTVCHNFGACNPCDVKLKTNRLQEYGHCSVEIMK